MSIILPCLHVDSKGKKNFSLSLSLILSLFLSLSHTPPAPALPQNLAVNEIPKKVFLFFSKTELWFFSRNSSAHITEWSLNPTAKNALLFLKNGNCIVILYQGHSSFSCLCPLWGLPGSIISNTASGIEWKERMTNKYKWAALKKQ